MCTKKEITPSEIITQAKNLSKQWQADQWENKQKPEKEENKCKQTEFLVVNKYSFLY